MGNRSSFSPLPRPMGALFLAPALILLCTFLAFPLIWVLFISFTDTTLTGPTAASPSFVGLSNFARLFDFTKWARLGEFGRALVNTAIFVLGSAILGQIPLGLVIALLFRRRKGFVRELVFSLATIAWILPGVTVAFAWIAFLDRDFGTFNTILAMLGFTKIDWYFDYPLYAIIIFNIWRGTAFSMLLFSAALENIPPSYWEIADVIGASAWQRFCSVVFPLIKPNILTALILVTLWTFNVFTPYLITGGGPLYRSETVPMYAYRVAFNFYEFGRGAAIAVVMMIINFILATTYLLFQRRRTLYGR